MILIDRREVGRKPTYESALIESLRIRLHDLFREVLPNCAEHRLLEQKVTLLRRDFLRLLEEISAATSFDNIEVIYNIYYHLISRMILTYINFHS